MSQHDQEADVVIVGAGGAALAAAIGAMEEGASVLMLEAGDAPGGTTRGSGGAFWIPDNHLMRQAGLSDPKADALKLMARLSYPSLYNPEDPLLGVGAHHHALLSAYYDEAAPALERMMALGAIDAMILPRSAPRQAPSQIPTTTRNWRRTRPRMDGC